MFLKPVNLVLNASIIVSLLFCFFGVVIMADDGSEKEALPTTLRNVTIDVFSENQTLSGEFTANFSDYTYDQLWSIMLNVSLADIDNIEFDDNSTDINDTLHHMNEFLTKICQRQTAPEFRIPTGFGKSAAERTTTFGFITEGVLLTAVSLFGLFGNIVAIIVLSRPAMKGSFSTLLIGLSSFDLLYLTVSIAIYGLSSMSPWYAKNLFVHILPMGFGLGHIGRVGSVFVTVSVTIERYFAICHPLRHFSGKKYLLVIPILSSILYNIPKFYELERQFINDTEGYEVYASDLRGNPIYVTYYIFWSKFLLVEVIPYFLIVILNSVIMIKIWKSNKFRRRFQQQADSFSTTHTFKALRSDQRHFHPDAHTGDQTEMTARQKREANLGVVLFSISVLFIVCQSVKIIPDLYEVIFCKMRSTPDDPQHIENPACVDGQRVKICKTNPVVEVIVDISHFLLAINSSANVIIYTLRGEKFREVLTSTFGLERFCTVPTDFRRRTHRSRIDVENKTETGLSLSTATTIAFKHQLASPLPMSSGIHLMPSVGIHNFNKSGDGCSQRFKDRDVGDDEEEVIVIISAESTC